MTYPQEISYRFQNAEDSDGSITFTVTGKDNDFVKNLINAIYLELDKNEYDMEGIVIENSVFRETRKILISKIVTD